MVYTDGTNSYINPPMGAALTTAVNQILIVFNAGVYARDGGIVRGQSRRRGRARIVELRLRISERGLQRVSPCESGVRGQGAGVRLDARQFSALIAGRITNADAKVYSLYDWAPQGRFDYRLESVSVFGIYEDYKSLAGPVVVDFFGVSGAMTGNDLALTLSSLKFDSICRDAAAAGRLFTRAASIQSDNNGSALIRNSAGSLIMPAKSVAPVQSQTNVAVRSAKTATSREASALNPSVAARWFSAGVTAASTTTAAKVQYVQPGVLAIPQASLPAGFDVHRAAIQREGRALPILALQDDTLFVYAPGYSDDYTGTDALFARGTSAATAAGSVAHAIGLFAGSQPVNTDSPASATASYHDVYFDYNLRPYTFAPWFSSQYLTDGTDQSFSLDTPFAGGGPAALTVTLWSLTSVSGVSPDHALQVVINGQPVGQTQWSGGQKLLQLSFEVPAGVLNAGTNRIELVTPTLDGVTSQICFLYSMNIDYTRTLDGSSPVSVFNTGSGTQLYELSRVPEANAWVVDARFPDRAALVPFETQVQTDGTYALRFTAAPGGSGQYLVVPFGQENAPVVVSKRQVGPIKPASATYWAVGESQFQQSVQPLLARRAKEGIKGAFIDQEQIFDYYNYGRYSPVAIQNAVRALRPQYLLLLGRTTYDYRNYSGLNIDPLCPAFLVSTTFWAQTTSDSMFGDLGRGYPEVAVGRLPVNNAAQLGAVVSRILSYAGAPESGVRVNSVADQADPEVADFAALSDALGQNFPDMAWQKNYLGVTCQTAPEVTDAMTAAANGGADWIVYSGHGNASRLGKSVPRILDVDHVQAWTGNVVFLQSTCTANWAAASQADFNSIVVQALTQPQGGISASIASSTYMNADCAMDFMSHLMTCADAAGMRWGNALMKAQQWAAGKGTGFYSDLNKTEQIFGDPAMPVFAPSARGSDSNSNGSGGSTAVKAGMF